MKAALERVWQSLEEADEEDTREEDMGQEDMGPEDIGQEGIQEGSQEGRQEDKEDREDLALTPPATQPQYKVPCTTYWVQTCSYCCCVYLQLFRQATESFDAPLEDEFHGDEDDDESEDMEEEVERKKRKKKKVAEEAPKTKRGKKVNK